MCGIAGVWDSDGQRVDEERLRAVAHSIRHRGPDDAGWYTSDGVGLVNVRLAILDVTDAAHQPMASDDGRFVLVYNGELYNFRELRTELEALGHRFRSSGDTEVVLRAFIEWGPD